jgi:hypothetical protein
MAVMVPETYLCPRCRLPIETPTGIPRQYRCFNGCTVAYRFN